MTPTRPESEKLYTLTEARMEVKRQECAIFHHRPTLEIVTVGERTGRWYCDCSTYMYAVVAPVAESFGVQPSREGD